MMALVVRGGTVMKRLIPFIILIALSLNHGALAQSLPPASGGGSGGGAGGSSSGSGHSCHGKSSHVHRDQRGEDDEHENEHAVEHEQERESEAMKACAGLFRFGRS